MSINSRFSEYTTSGAFAISLTRNQVSGLGLLHGGAPEWSAVALAGLERKGLAERVPNPTASRPDAFEWRATTAGLLTAALTIEAGLTNGPPDPVSIEMDSLRAGLIKARTEAADARRACRSALARKAEVELELHNLRADITKSKWAVRILPRDPLPDASDADLERMIGERA